MFKINDEVRVVRDCNGNDDQNCPYCPPIGLIGIIVKLGKHGKDDAACVDTYHGGQGMIRLSQFEYAGE